MPVIDNEMTFFLTRVKERREAVMVVMVAKCRASSARGGEGEVGVVLMIDSDILQMQPLGG